jgi:hypothetical protein
MKRLTMNCMLAAAALTAVATGASAQPMKAEIPFAFHAGAAVLAPGAYTVTLDRGRSGQYFQLTNVDTGRSVLVGRGGDADALKAWLADGKPRLLFECGAARCVLRQVWEGGGGRGHMIPGRSFGRDEAVRTTEIELARSKAE